ncbi:uncharacterized protein NEMAJ01_1482 [Nematocida major]|uniref:uncharacterized protein n=1 Tax=Nematocida major TaxID=1912982 RepID=UPI0020080C38|nr:uncharacterized protein NEMAJ01_1482 [Nematocida major]KAH9386586.1 hypothetical protein NEMAJ01_1482 [Nematocida major]
MGESEKTKRLDDLTASIIQLINSMQEVTDGLYRHTYDIDTELPQINKAVLQSAEKTVKNIKGELLVSEEVVSYVESREADINVLFEYVEEKEKEKEVLKNMALGKSKYFKMLHTGMQKWPTDK